MTVLMLELAHTSPVRLKQEDGAESHAWAYRRGPVTAGATRHLRILRLVRAG